jgi:hypothetical protein
LGFQKWEIEKGTPEGRRNKMNRVEKKKQKTKQQKQKQAEK